MYSTKAINDEIAGKLGDAEAITKLCEEEGREPTADEQTAFNALMDEIGEDAKEDQKATGLRAKLETAQRYERIRQQNRTADPATLPVPKQVVHGDSSEPFKIPRGALAHAGSLKAFTPNPAFGEYHVHDAYACGRWLMAMVGHEPSKHWCQDNIAEIYNVMTEGNPTEAGYLVPDEFSARIIMLREARGVFRQYADSEPMAGDHKTVGRRKTGATAYWVAEASSVTASDLGFNRVELTAKALAALGRMSRELDADAAVSIADRWADEAAYAFADKEDTAGFTGDGLVANGGIVGLVNKADDGSHTGALYTAVTGNTSFAELDLADFEKMAGQLPVYAEANAAWYIHKTGYWHSMANLVDAAGGNNIADLGRGPERMFLGYPVRFVQVMNSTTGAQVSTAGLCILGDLTLSSLVGNRQGIRTQVLLEKYADTREIGIINDERVAINNHTVTDPNDSTAAGPVVVLKTPAS